MQTTPEYTSYQGASPGGRGALAGEGRYPRFDTDLDFALDGGPGAAAVARQALLGLDGRVSPGLLADIRLLVSELVTNSVRHSGSASAAGVRMKVGLIGGTLRVEVSDAGRGFQPQPRAEGQREDSGWGLYLVDRIADRWGVLRSPVTVWFEIDRAAA
jgi:anti-sigma regulatory factor (Ser/Thr protein kinase)